VVDTLPTGTHTVTLALGDLSGILRGKRLHSSMWEKVALNGSAMANAIFVIDMTCDIWDTPYANMDTGYPDIHIKPIPGFLRNVPWSEGTVLAMCEATDEAGEPIPVDPRYNLKNVVAKAEGMGYQPKIGVELEFFLLDPETRQTIDHGIQVYGVARGFQFEHVLGPIRNHCTECGGLVEVSNPEYAPGQFEVNIHYDDAVTSADNAVLFKNAVKEIAYQHGLLATFMAKPFTEQSGSGQHIHQSFWKDGRNVFANGPHLSDVGKHYLAGLRAHMAEMTLFGAMTPNSYKRRAPYTFCPTNNSWGGDNRTVGIRVVEGREEAVRIEQRDGSADANPYLIVAAQLAAGLKGIEEEMDPGPPCLGDAYAEDGYEPLPMSLSEAIEVLKGSELAKETFDPDLITILIQMAEREQAFLASTVTDWERDRYLEVF